MENNCPFSALSFPDGFWVPKGKKKRVGIEKNTYSAVFSTAFVLFVLCFVNVARQNVPTSSIKIWIYLVYD